MPEREHSTEYDALLVPVAHSDISYSNKMPYADFCTELHDCMTPDHNYTKRLFTVKLLMALSDMQLYTDVLVDVYHVFKTLEDQLCTYAHHSCIGGLVPGELLRTDACKQDLKCYLGHMWRGEAHISRAGETYCRQIVSAAMTDPELLIAYVHSLYLALLSGGVVMKRMIKTALLLPDDTGLAIFTFGPHADCHRQTLKENINKLIIGRTMKDAIIREKLNCYELNNSLVANVTPSSRSYTVFLKTVAGIAVVGTLLYFAIRWSRK